MKDNKKSALQEAREEYLKQQEQEQHINFIKSMENKKLKELNIAQQSYLYKEHNKLYQELKNNPERVIEDLLTLDTLKAREKDLTYIVEHYSELKQEVEKYQPIINNYLNNL